MIIYLCNQKSSYPKLFTVRIPSPKVSLTFEIAFNPCNTVLVGFTGIAPQRVGHDLVALAVAYKPSPYNPHPRALLSNTDQFMIAPDYYVIRPSRGLNTAFFVSVCSVAPLKETMCKVHRQQQQCSTNNVVVDVGANEFTNHRRNRSYNISLSFGRGRHRMILSKETMAFL